MTAYIRRTRQSLATIALGEWLLLGAMTGMAVTAIAASTC